MITEIMLCNNGLSRNNVCGIIMTLKQLQVLKSIFIYELQKHLHGIKVAKYLLHIIKCSFVISEDKVVIGNQASFEQLGRCLRLVSPSTTILRFISCRFGNEHYDTLVDVLSRLTTLKEFSLFECNTTDIWTKQLVEALQVKSSLKSLSISCKRVTPLKADSLTNALCSVIGNNPTLEKVSFKLNNLPSSSCGKIFQALSNIEHLKYFKFCDGQITSKEALDQLCKVIANNSSLEVINLRNNKLRSSGIKAIAKDFKNICNLKLLELSGNQLDEEAADDIASIISNNVKIEKLLLHNNALKSEGICKICQALKWHENLQVFRISKTGIQEEAADDIAEVVNHNSSLKVFDVAHNRLLTKGIIQIAIQLRKITTLLKLSLNDNNITCTDTAAACVEKNKLMLVSLCLGNNNFSVSDVSVIAKAIKKFTGLRELTVNNTGFTADHISTMIANNLLLEILDIGDNKLKSEGISDISKALIKLSHLRVLGLYGNDITDDAADDIAGVISKLPVLAKLYLNKNKFGVGMKSICESLCHNKALKLLQLDDVGITEEVADDIAAVIDCNPLLECIYLGNNNLCNTGANVILSLLKNKRQFKALGLNSNCISDDVVDNVVQFVTSNPELEELILNNNHIGTTGVINIYRCIKDINTLKVFDLTDNNVNDKATDAFVSIIESNTALEEISLDGNILSNSNISTIITRLSNLRSLQINCKMVSENNIYSIFANCNIEEIALNYLVDEMYFLYPVNTIETVVVIKANVSKSDTHIPVLHSVVMENKIEIVCTQDDVLVKSEVMKMINVQTFKRLMLVFTRMNCFTDQEINNLASTFANDGNINSLTISKLNADKYNSDVSGIVIIEESEMIVMLTDGNLTATGITKFIHDIISFKIIYVGSVDKFFNQNINEMVQLIFGTTKLKYFLLRNDCIHVSAMENVFSCLTRTITIKTIRVLNNLNIRNFDFSQKSDKLSSQIVDEIDNSHLDKIFCALRHKVDFKGLDLCGITINKEVAQSISFLINETNKIELLNLKNCSLGMSLKHINLQKITTLKWLSLSNNNLTEEEPIRTILENNTMLEKLSIEQNCFQLSAGDKLGIAVTTLRNLKEFRIDENIVSREMVLKLTTDFSVAACKTLHIYNHHYQSTEGITVTGSLHNITTLTLLKLFGKVQGVSFLAGVLKTGVMFSLWDQDNALRRAGVIRWLSSSRSITAIKLLNASRKRLTEEEEDTIVTVIKGNMQLEKVLLGSQSLESVIDDFVTYNEHNCKIVPDRHKPISTTKINDTSKIRGFPLEFLFKIVFALKDHTNLKALNLSVCLNDAVTEDLAEQLTVVLANSTKLETLLLEDCYFGNNGLNLIANSLKNIPTLKDLDLSNNDITEDSLLVSILEANIGLEKLRLHKNCLHSTAGDRLVVAIVKLRNLKELSIDNYIISRRMAMKLATVVSPTTERILFIYDHDSQAMEKMIIKGPLFSINTLSISKELITESDLSTGCRVMTINYISETGIVSLIWGQSNMSTSGVLRFLNSLKQITTLEFLNIKDTGITELEVDTIVNVISENEQLQNILLSTEKLVSISDSTFFNSIPQLFPNIKLQIILCALQNITELRTLDLSGNVITEELTEQLAIVLANSTKLETLLLEDCSLSNEGVSVIANSLKSITTVTLKHLNLSNNNITEEVAIVNILNGKVKLEELYLHKNCLQLSAGGNLSDYVVNLECLKVLSIDHNIISSSMIMKFTDSYFPSNEIELYIYNSDHQTTEMIKFRDSFKDISVLTLRKSYNEKRNKLLVTLILGNESGLHWNQSNVLTPTGVVRFLSAFRNITTLKMLNFSGSEFTKLEVDTIVTVISENVQLENLWLCVKALNANDSNKQLVSPNQMKAYFWNQKMFSRKLLLRLFLALRFNTNLKRLDLSSNVITEELTEQLAIVLANSTKLETLLLRDSSLGNEGVNVIANSLKNITTLKHLDLSNNEITKESVIVAILEANIGLERLHLKQNYLHSTTGDRLSDAIINLKNLKELGIDQYIISSITALKLLSFYANTNGRLFVYNHDYQTTEMLHNEGSLCNINTLTLCKFSIDIPLRTTVLETEAAVLRWHQANSLRATGILKVFSAVNNITTIKLQSFDNELNEMEVDTIASIISDNIALTNVWLGSHSCKVAYDDFDTLTSKHTKYVDCIDDLELPPPKLQLIPHTQLFKILIALRHNVNLNTLDLSGNVITEGLAEQLAIVLANSTKLETLLLRDCSLSSAGIRVITNSLKNATSLKQLSLSWDNIITDVEYLTTVIGRNVGLEKLFLDGNLQCYNHLSTVIKKLYNLELLEIDYKVMFTTCELVAFLINGKLKYLILKNHSLQITGVVKFESYPRNIKSLMVIRTAGQDPTSVKASVDDSKITVTWSKDTILASTGLLGMFSLFKGLTSVSWLNLTLNEYSEQDIDEIVTTMASFTGLEELVIGGYSTALQNCILSSLTTRTLTNPISLDLSCSRMNTNAITKLATFIRSGCKILELKLNFCLLTSSQVTKIINALQTQSDMRSLCLFSNNITNGHGVTVDIAQVLLNNNQSMQKFYIGNNRLKTRDITKILEVLKQCHKLTELLMGPYSIFDDISDNCKLEMRPDEFVAEIITNNPELRVLGLTCTCAHADGAAKVVTALKSLSCLKILDISGNNINEEVADDVATVFTNNPDLTKLSISDNCLGTAGISKIADALASRKGLEVLDITNTNISSGVAESVSKMIANNSRLKALLLGRENVRNVASSNNESLSNIFINTVMIVIKQYAKINLLWFFFTYCITLSSNYCHKVFSDNLALNTDFLILNNNKLQSQGIKGISKALATIKSLEVLSIENNDVDDEAADDIAAALTSNIGIKQLWIGQNKFTLSGISTILQPLTRATSNKLEVLDLSHSNLLLTTTILEMLSKNYNIQQLWLEENNLSSQSITTIVDALKKCINISVLSLRDNNISEEVADVLSEALSKNLNLQQLYLGNNHLQDRGVIKITEALNTTEYLQTLDLMNNNISEAAADAVASVITSCSQLEQLYLGDNKLQSTGTIKITRSLQQAKCRSTLRVLDLSNNRIAGSDETIGDEISRAVGNTEILTVLILDDNAISVDGVWKITRSLSQSAEYMMIFSVMHNDVMISEETKDEMRAVMAGQQPDCAMYL